MKDHSWAEKNGLTIGSAITVLLFIVGSLAGTIVFAFTTFATKDGVRNRFDRTDATIEKRLDNIENEIHDLNSYLRDNK